MGKRKGTEEDHDVGSFPKKWAKKLPEGFADRAEGFDSEELKKKIVEWEQAISSTEKDMENDEKLLALKEEAKEAADVYKQSITESNAMIRYAVFLLEGRGAA